MDYDKVLLYYLLLESLEDKPEPRHVRHIHNTTVEGVTSHPLLKDVTEDQHHHHAYGGMYVHDNATPSVGTTTGTWYQFSLFNENGVCHETVPDHTQNHITVGLTGDYLVNVSLSMFDAQAKEWEFAVHSNNGTVYWDNIECQATMLAASKVVTTSFCGLTSFTAGDTVELWYKLLDLNDPDDLTVKLANLNIVRIL